ncbi:MAG: hypothetical protein IGQ45_05250 [Cyanobacterium sp. T60_A2020_053]|nr:hypothetical protein [Cyanobacterium sp. T60_A2020_053]
MNYKPSLSPLLPFSLSPFLLCFPFALLTNCDRLKSLSTMNQDEIRSSSHRRRALG